MIFFNKHTGKFDSLIGKRHFFNDQISLFARAKNKGVSYIMPLFNKKKAKFIEIYNDYYQIVHDTIYSKTGEAHDTDELTREVFIAYYSKMDEIENVRAWLFGAIKNVLFNYFRKKKGISNENIENYLDDVSVTFVNGLHEARTRIQEAIVRLNEQDRLLFDLIAVQNLTFELAGKHLGLTKRGAQYQYSLIVKEIRQYLINRGIKKYRGSVIKEDLLIMQKVLDKYKISAPIDREIQEYSWQVKRKNLSNILKNLGLRSSILSAILLVYFY